VSKYSVQVCFRTVTWRIKRVVDWAKVKAQGPISRRFHKEPCVKTFSEKLIFGDKPLEI